MATVHLLRTGSVLLKRAQVESRGGARAARVLFDREWTEWLPISAWLIEHEEGLILVDTGAAAAVHQPGYLPAWHPFLRRATRFRVAPEEELGPQLRRLGAAASDVRQVVLTHLHLDHAGGLAHVPQARAWVSPQELAGARGLGGRLQGYLPQHWPPGWQPELLRFAPCAVGTPGGPFPESMALTRRGDVVVVPTPGHTLGHVSVVVLDLDHASPAIFITGDAAYSQALLQRDALDGTCASPTAYRQSASRIRALAAAQPLVVLPTHDPDSGERLRALVPC